MCSCVRSPTVLTYFQLQPCHVTETIEVKETRCRRGRKIHFRKACRETGSQIVEQFCSKSLVCKKMAADDLNVSSSLLRWEIKKDLFLSF